MAGNFKQINVTDEELSLIQDNVQDALDPMLAAPTYGISLLQSVSLTAGQDNLIAHKLGRNLQFWILAGLSADARVWSPVSAQIGNVSSNDRYLNLWCSASCTINLLVN